MAHYYSFGSAALVLWGTMAAIYITSFVWSMIWPKKNVQYMGVWCSVVMTALATWIIFCLTH